MISLLLRQKSPRNNEPDHSVALELFWEEDLPEEEAPLWLFNDHACSCEAAGLEELEARYAAYLAECAVENTQAQPMLDQFRVNEEAIDILQQSCQNGVLRFSFDEPNARILNDHPWGRVWFTVKLWDGTALYSRLVPVYVNPNDRQSRVIGRSLSGMACYVLERCEAYWGAGRLPGTGEELPSLAPSGIRPCGQRGLSAQIHLAEDIVRAYERVLPSFRTGCEYRVRSEKQWVSFERAAHLTGDTFHSILQRPYNLRPSRGGVRLPDREGRERCYTPGKVIAAAGQVDYDIYENQYVVGFLRYLADELARMLEALDRLMGSAAPGTERAVGDTVYVDGSRFLREFMFRLARKRLETARVRVFRLHAAYRRLLPVSAVRMREPRPTAIFRSVHHYREIYELACRWFRFGVYDFRREDMFLPFVAGHRLYEYYVLMKLLDHVEEQGFALRGRKAYYWTRRGLGEYTRVEDPPGKLPTVFFFQREDAELAVFCEPHIFEQFGEYNAQQTPPELKLFRTSPPGRDRREPWKPDYVVKVQKTGGPASYLVLDAKFSIYDTAAGKKLPQACGKYLSGMHQSQRGDQILGLCLLCGKPAFDEAGGVDPLDLTDPVRYNRQWNGFYTRVAALRPENEEVHGQILSAALPLEECEI